MLFLFGCSPGDPQGNHYVFFNVGWLVAISFESIPLRSERYKSIAFQVQDLLIHFVGGLVEMSVGLPRAWFFSSPRKCLRNPSVRFPGLGSDTRDILVSLSFHIMRRSSRIKVGILPVASPGASGSCGFRPYCFSLMAR